MRIPPSSVPFSVPSSVEHSQTPWARPSVVGVRRDATGAIDRTEGLGAFLDLPFQRGSVNLDVGGQASDTNTRFLALHRGVVNHVYDPYARSARHNARVLAAVGDGRADTTTSMSVLNVIDTAEARRAHVELCHRALKPGGTAYFRVWAGDGSGIGRAIPGGFQSNRGAATYRDDVAEVFGPAHVEVMAERHLLVARKR